VADIFEVVDRISVLRLGRNNGVFSVPDTSQEAIVGAITGAEFGHVADAKPTMNKWGGRSMSTMVNDPHPENKKSGELSLLFASNLVD